MKVRLIVDVEELGVAGDVVEIEESEFDVELHEKMAAAPKKAAKSAEGGEDLETVKRIVDEQIEADKQHAAQVHRLCEHYGLDEIWERKQINARLPIKKIAELAAEERARRNPAGLNIGEDFESWDFRHEQMGEAIAARAINKPTPDSAREFAHHSLVDMAFECLKANRKHRGVNQRDRARVVELALSTSDYPNLLANAGNKILLPAYNAANPTFRLFCIEQNVADFKSVSILNAGDFPAPLQVGENGEIKLGYFAEQKNTVALGTYGRRLAFSRQMLINDDLGSFGRVMGSYGLRIADYQNAAFYTLLSTQGPTLGDTGLMFNATALTTAGGHANYTSSGTAISDTAITVGYALMAAQTGIGADNLGDGIKLNIQPKYLLAAPGKRNLAFQYTSANYVPSSPTNNNAWAGLITPVFDANLSGNRWWLFADPSMFPNFAYGSLAGAPGPRVSTRQGFEVEGVELKVAFDFYVGGIDWRGGYCNAGA